MMSTIGQLCENMTSTTKP